MKSKKSSCTTTYLILIVFCILFVYVVFQKRQNVQLQEGLKMKDLKKFGKKIKKESESFATGLFTIGIALLLGLLILFVLGSIICAVYYFSLKSILPIS